MNAPNSTNPNAVENGASKVSLAECRMANAEHQKEKIGSYVARGSRNAWAESIEELVRDRSPFPISYDVVSTLQTMAFTEYSYTELVGGFWVQTQSIELNNRLLDFASRENCGRDLSELSALTEDKYIMDAVPSMYKNVKRICFLPGSNCLDIASLELTARLAHEEDDVYFKPHPITDDKMMRVLKMKFGAHRLIPKNVSGATLLRQCDEVFTSAASEMAITGTILGKKVVNISNFFHESRGAYHPISRALFLVHRKRGVEEAQRVLANIVYCPWSGVFFPFTSSDLEARIDSYFKKTMEMRDMYRPLSSPFPAPSALSAPQPKSGEQEPQKRQLVPMGAAPTQPAWEVSPTR